MQGEDKYINILEHIQFHYDVSDILHPLSGYHSYFQNFQLQNISITNTPYRNKLII